MRLDLGDTINLWDRSRSDDRSGLLTRLRFIIRSNNSPRSGFVAPLRVDLLDSLRISLHVVLRARHET